MANLPGTPADFFAQLLAGGALYGLVVTWLLDGLLALWEGHAGAPVSGTKRRWLSIAIALLVPILAYGGLVLLGAATFTADGVYSAVLVGVAATAGKQVAYAGRESLSKPQGTAMRAAPALEPAPAPEAGAPSLAEQIARDNGLEPEAHD